MKKVTIKQQEKSLKLQKQQSQESEQIRDETMQLDFVSKIKKRESMYINYQGMFQSAHFNYNHSLSLMYTTTSSENWKLTHGQNTGISQHAAQGDKYLVWNFPFQLMYEIKNPSGWPQMTVVIHGKDYLGRSVVRGYGNFHLPSSSGLQVRKIQIFDVLPPTSTASCCAFLMGYINELKQPQKVLLEAEGGRQCLRVKPIGEVTVKIQVRRYNFQKFGYQ